jgi:hypothetical protein
MGNATPTELWTLNRGRDAVKCVAANHPHGLELRYVMNQSPLMSRVFDSWDTLAEQARTWRDGLEARGWEMSARPNYAYRR